MVSFNHTHSLNKALLRKQNLCSTRRLNNRKAQVDIYYSSGETHSYILLALSSARNYVSLYFWNTHARILGRAFWGKTTVDRMYDDNFVFHLKKIDIIRILNFLN